MPIPLSGTIKTYIRTPASIPHNIGELNDIPTVDPATVGVGVFFASLSLLFLLLRILCTVRERRWPKIEEYSAVVGFAIVGAYLGAEMSLGYTSDRSEEFHAFMFTTKYCVLLFAAVVLAAPAQAAPKLALAALLVRLLIRQRTAPWENRGLIRLGWVCVALSLVFSVVSVVHASLSCSAVGGNWMPRVKCSHSMSVIGIVGGALWVIFNGVMWIMAWRLVVGGKTGQWKRKKKQLVVVGLGALAPMVSSILGMSYRILIDGNSIMLWHGFVVQGCVYVDAYATLILCCTPALQYFRGRKGCFASFSSYIYSLFVNPPTPFHPRNPSISSPNPLRFLSQPSLSALSADPVGPRTPTGHTTEAVSPVSHLTPTHHQSERVGPPPSAQSTKAKRYGTSSSVRRGAMGTDEWAASEMGNKIRRALEASGLQGVLDRPSMDGGEGSDQERGPAKWPEWLENDEENEVGIEAAEKIKPSKDCREV